jgi:hypothetical protein
MGDTGAAVKTLAMGNGIAESANNRSRSRAQRKNNYA